VPDVLLYKGCLPSVYVVCNMDFQNVAPQIELILHKLHETRQRLENLWAVKKNKLEHALQLRLFEADVEKVNLLLFII
jgi:hypothetical protein